MQSPAAAHGNILVVDDDPQLQILIERILSRAGFACTLCADGREVLNALDAEVERAGPAGWSPWDLLLLDVTLPDILGFDLLEAIRKRRGFENVPVLFMSGARLANEDIERGLELGALDYLAKPFRSAILLAKVRNFAELGRFRRLAHQTALALEESEAWHRELFHGSSQGIIVMDENFTVLRGNPAAAQLFRTTPDRLKGITPPQFIPSEDWEMAEREMETLRRTGSLHRSLWSLRRSGDTTFWAHVHIDRVPLWGKPCYVAFLEDATERVESQQRIAELSEFRANLIENANVWISTMDLDGNVTTWNRAAEAMSGYSAAEVLGHAGIWERLYPDPFYCQEVRAKLMAVISSTTGGELETPIMRKDGRRRIIAWTANAMLGTDNRPIGLICVGQDVTDRRRMEEDLRRHSERLEDLVAERTQTIHRLERERAEAEKFAAQGQVAAAIAHEINNPLATIQNCMTIISEGNPASPEIRRYFDLMRKEVERIGRIVSQTYDLYQPLAQQAALVQVNDILGGLLQTLEQKLRQKGITLLDHRAPDLPKILAPPGFLTQIFFNVIRNAMDAMNAGGQLEILTTQHDKKVITEIADTGPGIAPEHLPHVFEPFFTTRRGRGRDSGLGLGLSISRSLVEALQGNIAVVSTSPRGTRIRISLPSG
ncbi:MAG: PAS domain S-box protein [Candidatus Sumerlaeia bacterium]|nr:PAS domain S-box protein [Candidatus Sumerlaeia bacterium]